ncbi:MAG: hypothetical protein ACLR6A_10865 [Candidatus Gastranaerophilaceae bacterium]
MLHKKGQTIDFPARICIIGIGLYLSIRTRFLQIRKFPYAIKTTIGRIFHHYRMGLSGMVIKLVKEYKEFD